MSERKIHDGSRLESNLALEGDVAIIGTGAGGGTAAEILSQAGLKVVLIEEGGYFTARDFSLHESQAYPDLYYEGGVRNTEDKGIQFLQGRAVGGSTVVNWTSSFRTPAKTLEHWGRAHGLQGFGEAEMAPWFERMEQRLNIHKWDVPPNENNRILYDGARKLGWHADIIARNVKDCANLGYCGMGCPLDAKLSMAVTTIPAALDAGAELISRVRIERLEIQGDRVVGIEGSALHADGVRLTGHKVRISAPHVVLAAGSIGSPAVLLRSKAPDPDKLVGKRTFLHPVAFSAAIMPEPVEGHSGAPQSAYSAQFLFPGPDAGSGPMGYKLEVPPLHPVFVSLNSREYSGRAHAEMMAKLPNLHLQLALMRDGFHPESVGGTVKLRDDGSAVLDYPITDYVWEGMRRAYLSMAEVQFAAGALSVKPRHMDASEYRSWAEAKAAIPSLPMKVQRALLGSAHVMGGCPMGEDPKTSVVNSWGRHHQLANLSVLDGSAFPTSIGANPQLSIYAMVARNATRLAEELGGTRQTAGG